MKVSDIQVGQLYRPRLRRGRIERIVRVVCLGDKIGYRAVTSDRLAYKRAGNFVCAFELVAVADWEQDRKDVITRAHAWQVANADANMACPTEHYALIADFMRLVVNAHDPVRDLALALVPK